HLSLQAGDNMILKRMKRRHNREQAIALCRHLKSRRRDIVFGADIIAGFPTETDAMFENSLRLIKQCGLVWLHVFPFSPRPNTPAAKMPQLPDTTIKARAAALRKAGAKHRTGWLARQKNKVQQVLVEKADMGRCENFARIHIPQSTIPQNRAKSGDIIAMRVSGHDGDALKGAVL
ncbi:MAG: radical SAM protein, partial [Parvibaculales bacterium]